MEIPFYKYHGAGNDFILIDNMEHTVTALTTEQVAKLCHRRFGIGADGLMLLQRSAEAGFEMVYYNADGNLSTMCGNGGRCIAALANHLGIVGRNMTFKAVDGIHEAQMLSDDVVALHMQDVKQIDFGTEYTLLDTGSPHLIKWVDDLEHTGVFREGRELRNRPAFQPKGINVNFVQRLEKGIAIRTYERGVEDETLACGTGVTAAAIVSAGEETGAFDIPVKAMGGDLSVSFTKRTATTAEHIVLTGGATFVFKGTVEI
jgi:diaminopimelate epimerase